MIKVELATPSDAEDICRIRDEAWLEAYPNKDLGITQDNIKINTQGLHGEFIPRRIAWFKQKTSETNKNWVAYVGKIDGVIRGFAVASINKDGKRFLDNIYIEPGYQKRGLGKELMDTLLNWLGDESDIYLEVTSYNDNAIRFYEHFGFKKTTNKVEPEPNLPDFITHIPQTEMVRPAKTKSSV